MVYACKRSDKPVSAARHRLDVLRVVRRISQGSAHLINRRVQTMLEVHERSLAPYFLAQLFPAYRFARVLEQNEQYLKRLARQPYSNPVLSNFPRPRRDFERSEYEGLVRSLHLEQQQSITRLMTCSQRSSCLVLA